jgi:hypothetical protein
VYVFLGRVQDFGGVPVRNLSRDGLFAVQRRRQERNHSLVGSGGEDSGCVLVGDRMEGFTNIAVSFALERLLVQCLFKIIALSRCFQTAAPFSEPFLTISRPFFNQYLRFPLFTWLSRTFLASLPHVRPPSRHFQAQSYIFCSTL